MMYQVDNSGRVWLNDGVIVPECGTPWDDYQAWLQEGNTPETLEDRS